MVDFVVGKPRGFFWSPVRQENPYSREQQLEMTFKFPEKIKMKTRTSVKHHQPQDLFVLFTEVSLRNFQAMNFMTFLNNKPPSRQHPFRIPTRCEDFSTTTVHHWYPQPTQPEASMHQRSKISHGTWVIWGPVLVAKRS